MDKGSYKILLIEDDEGDVFLFQEIISEVRKIELVIQNVSTLNDAFDILKKEKFDVVLTDLGLPDSKGLDTFIKLIEKHPYVPIVVLTGLNDDEVGIAAIKYGAQDYIVKGAYDAEKIIQTIRYSYNRKRIENELRASTERFKSVAENIQDGLTIIENDEIVYVNSRMVEITGYSFDELKAIYNNDTENESQLNSFFKHLSNLGNYYGDESIWIKRKNGRRCFLRNRSSIKKINGNQIIKYIATTDITEQWRNDIIKEFVNTISSSVRIVENEKDFFKVIYKEIRKIFRDKDISLGILNNTESINFIYAENKEIHIQKYPLSESMCSMLLEEIDAAYYNEAELLDFSQNKNIKFKGGIPKSWLGASLYNNDKKHGVLILKDFENDHAFNENDLELMKYVAHQITLAIQKNKSEEKINQLSLSVEQSPAGIEITDIKGKIQYVNNRFCEITGYDKDEVIGKNPRILKSGQTTSKTYEDLWQTIKNGEIWKGIFVNKRKSGEIYYEEAKISPLLNKDNEITHFVAIKEDISERIIKEKELLKAKEKAEESDQLKSSFLANMSHEVRTPMNGIMGFSQFLKDPDLNQENKLRYIKIINDSCNQLLRIIEDILEISKLETGQIEIMNEEFEPADVLNNVFINHNEICEQKGIKFSLVKEIQQNRTLYSDRTKVTTILNNLVSNAIKFTHEGNIEIGGIDKNDYIEFYVKDTGIGVEPEIIEKIFERFRQAEVSMSRTYGGTGLGLAIAKGYADLMNIEIGVNSTLNVGSTFYVKIPIKKSKIIKNTSTEIEYNEPIISFQNASVLVAEDEEINYQYIKRVFNGIGIENIIRAHNGKEAVDAISRDKGIDLIMMDLKMPILNGFEATKKIKSTNPKIPIIAQTALAIPGDKKRALEAGCDDYISKPIDYDKLIDLIEKYIVLK